MDFQIPQKYIDMVGTEIGVEGNVFSRKSLPNRVYRVLDIRKGHSCIRNIHNKNAYKYPTFELLLKSDFMQKAQWSKAWPIKEINLLEPSNSK